MPTRTPTARLDTLCIRHTGLLAKGSNRIIDEVRGINRVVYDISGKPPATIEWEQGNVDCSCDQS